MRKRISVILAVCFIVSQFFIVPFNTSALEWGDITDFTLDFETTYTNPSGGVYYYNGDANWTKLNSRGSATEQAIESNGNTAVRFTYDNENGNENYNANPAINIYNPATNTKFIGEAGKTYTISFSYKVERNDGKTMQFNIGTCGRSTLGGSDLKIGAMQTDNKKIEPIGNALSEVTGEYVTVSGEYTANGKDYPIILLVTNNNQRVSTTSNFASVLVDNIRIKEKATAKIICYNYNGNDKELTISYDTDFSELAVPTRKGYVFDGWYKDAGLTQKALGSDLVGECEAIYVKWLGDGTAITPEEITEAIEIGALKGFGWCDKSQSVFTNTKYIEDATKKQTADVYVPNAFDGAWKGAYVISSDTLTGDIAGMPEEKISLQWIGNIDPNGDSVIFYVELPEYEKSGASWAIRLNQLVINQNASLWANLDVDTNCFSYLSVDGENWKESTFSNKQAYFNGLPSGFKGYIRIDFSKMSFYNTVDFDSAYSLEKIDIGFNSVGGDCGNLVLGGIFYIPTNKSQSTVMKVNDKYYDLTLNRETVVVNSYPAFEETNSSFAVRYSGTNGSNEVKFVEAETSALMGKSPIGIESISGDTLSTSGFMNTYIYSPSGMIMNPGADTFMIYVEMPEYTSDLVALKLLYPEIRQGNKTVSINAATSAYSYLDIEKNKWINAISGADGELTDIKSGFMGYIKVNIKDLKGFSMIDNIDFSSPYYLSRLELAFNNVGGGDNKLVIGGVYSVLKDSNAVYLSDSVTGEKYCAKIINGDLSCDGRIDADDVVLARKLILGLKVNGAAELRSDIYNNGSKLNVKGLVRIKKAIAGTASIPQNGDYEENVADIEIFTDDYVSSNQSINIESAAINNYAAVIESTVSEESINKGNLFAKEITENFIADFEKSGIDLMCHVSTFIYNEDTIYMTYYANTQTTSEDPFNQTARFVYCPIDNPENQVIIDIQSAGEFFYGYRVYGVYDTILAKADDTTIYILWTANIEGKYYRLYRTFDTKTKQLGEIGVNKFKVGEVVNDFSTSGISSALTANGIGCKKMYADIGIMQKFTTRVENGKIYYYTGAYSGDFNCIIKSTDFITWEYVAQPSFANQSKWENAVYVLNDKCYYFVRQQDGVNYGFLTAYDLNTGVWDTPVLIADCQSRSDFIIYNGELYLFHAPIDREHIGIVRINTSNLAESTVVLQAKMDTSCFYPFIQYGNDGELRMSYTINRQHIRLAKFTLSDYIN